MEAVPPTDKLSAVSGFDINRLTGFNGLVATYQAFHRGSGIPVALHAVSREALTDPQAAWESFSAKFDELAHGTASRLCHPVGCGEDAGHYFAAYRWLTGSHVGIRVRDKGLPTPALALEWTGQVAQALRILHASGLLHRMINPASVFLNDLEQAALLHGGWGQIVLRVPSGLRNPAWASVLPFASPEAATGGELDEAADVFSLGAMLYYLLCGNPPFWDSDPEELVRHIESHSPDFGVLQTKVPASVLELLEELMQKTPKDRPVNLPALADRLEALAVEAERFTNPPEDPSPADQPSSESGIQSAILSARKAIEEAEEKDDQAKAAQDPGPDTTGREPSPQKTEGGRGKAQGAARKQKRGPVVALVAAAVLVVVAGIGYGLMQTLFTSPPPPPPTERRPEAPAETRPGQLHREYDQAARQLRQLGQYLRGYERQYGTWPSDPEDLAEFGAAEELFVDPWGETVHLRANFVVSAGADGTFDNEDDIWFDAEEMRLEGYRPPLPGRQE